MTRHKGSSSSLSVGYRFYYWEYYRNKDEAEYSNLDHAGLKVCELYVKKRYGTFKEEILNYRHFGLIGAMIGLQKATNKASKYIETQIAKATTAKVIKGYLSPQHYEIYDHAPLGINNLVSLILYTDFDGLSSHFSRSFRKIHAFETIDNVKQRNSYYWWWSKTLRETVELYGISKDASFGRNTGLNGPFFTGLSCVMNIPQFVIRLHSPTSTSVHIEVATKFAGDDGMIIQLDIGEIYFMSGVRGFDCAWISQYKEEDERYCHSLYIFISTFLIF